MSDNRLTEDERYTVEHVRAGYGSVHDLLPIIDRLASQPDPEEGKRRNRRPRGLCPVCGNVVSLKKDGTCWVHRVPNPDGRGGMVDCRGSKLAPLSNSELPSESKENPEP